MKFLSGLFRSRDKPRNSTSGSSYRFFYGQSSSGKCVTERSAMQMTAVYTCVRILSEAVAGLPLHLYKWGDSGSKEKAVDHPLYFLLHDEPNKEMTSFIFRETLMTHLLLWGNAYAQIIRNGKYKYFWFYRVKFGIPATSLATKGDSITFSTPTIEGTIMRRNKVDGNNNHPWKAEVTEGENNVSNDTITNWYKNVYEPAYTSPSK